MGTKNTDKSVIKFESLPESGFDKCVTCGEATSGYAFCRKCFRKHTEEEMLDILNSSYLPQTKKYETLPESGFEKCVECGEPTTGYAFCKKCYRKHTEEEMIDILNGEKNVIKVVEPNLTPCLICGSNTEGSIFCKSCFKEIMNAQINLDKNKKPWELKDYYYNLKAFIVRLKNYDEGISNLYKMYAIALLLQKLYNDNQLIDNVFDDIKYLIKILERIKNYKPNDIQIQNDKVIVAVADEKNRASDGHICKSKGEVTIDNILFKFQICHAYERKVKEIPQSERSIIADWFVPLSGADGIYIEFWGMDTKDYQDNKEEKLKIYEKYKDKVKLIQINKNDVNDSQILEDRIYQELEMLGWKK